MFTKGQLTTLLQMHNSQAATQAREAHDRFFGTGWSTTEHPFIRTLKDLTQNHSIVVLKDDDTLPDFALFQLELVFRRDHNPNISSEFRDAVTQTTIERFFNFKESSQTSSSPQSLLEYVVRGQQHSAVRYACAEALTQEQQTKTYAGQDIIAKPFEYALWARDMAMCRALKPKMSCEMIAEQMRNLEKNGIGALGRCFNLQPYKQACENYFQFVRKFGKKAFKLTSTSTETDKVIYNECSRLYILIGKAQFEFPVHYIHEYYRTDRALLNTDGKIPIFDAANLPGDSFPNPSRQILTMDPYNNYASSLYLDTHPYRKPGVLIRYNMPGPFISYNQEKFLNGETTFRAVKSDYHAICAFNDALETEYELLKELILRNDEQLTSHSSSR